jgi:hypothetical protein
MGLNHSVEQRADRGMCRAGMHGQRPQLPSRRGDEPQRPCHETHVTCPHARGGASASPCRDQDRQATECHRHHRRPAERAQPAADPRIAERCRDQCRHTPPRPRPRRADHRRAHARQCAPAAGSVRSNGDDLIRHHNTAPKRASGRQARGVRCSCAALAGARFGLRHPGLRLSRGDSHDLHDERRIDQHAQSREDGLEHTAAEIVRGTCPRAGCCVLDALQTPVREAFEQPLGEGKSEESVRGRPGEQGGALEIRQSLGPCRVCRLEIPRSNFRASPRTERQRSFDVGYSRGCPR